VKYRAEIFLRIGGLALLAVFSYMIARPEIFLKLPQAAAPRSILAGQLDIPRLSTSVAVVEGDDVTCIRIVDADDLSVLRRDQTGAKLTLITCYPFRYIGAAPRRYIVEARLSK
jgi:hypothetical protein